MSRYPMVPLKRFGAVVGGATPRDDDANWGGGIPWYTPTDISKVHGGTLGDSARTLTDAGLDACSAPLLPPGAVVITSRAPIGNAALTDRPAATNQGCKSLAPAPDSEARYVLYAVRSFVGEIRIAGTGTTFQEVSGERLGRVRLPKPDFALQGAIADFLDRECGRINSACNLGERLVAESIQLLAAERSRLLGIDELEAALVSGRPSEGRKRLKHVVEQWFSGATPKSTEARYWTEPDNGGTPWVSISDMSRREVVTETAKHLTPEGRASTGQAIAPAGTILFAMYASMGETARLSVDAAFNQAILGLWVRDEADREFLGTWLRALQPLLGLYAKSNTQANLTAEVVKNLPFTSLGRIDRIAANRQVRSLRERANHTRRYVDLLRSRLDEYRDCLIHDAVTGKIDVTRASENQMEEQLHAATEGRRDEVPA